MSEHENRIEEYGNKVRMTGTLVNKRFNDKTKGDPVLNLFIRTGNSRKQTFCIGVNVWGKEAKVLNKTLRREHGMKDGQTLDEEEAPLLEIKGEMRWDHWEDDDGTAHGRHTVTAKSVTIQEDEEEEYEEDEYEDEEDEYEDE